MDNSNYTQEKFNYGLETEKDILNNSRLIDEAFVLKNWDRVFDLLELQLNHISIFITDVDYKKYKGKFNNLREICFKFIRYKGKKVASRRLSNGISSTELGKMKKELFDIDFEFRKILRKKGVNMPKARDEMKSIIEGKE